MTTQFHRVLYEGCILLPTFMLVFTFRGFSRALVARLNGDDTAYKEGFVSLSPLAHIDLAGLLVFISVILVLGFIDQGFLHRTVLFMLLAIMGVRWTYDVPVESSKFRSHTLGMLSTIFAGPLGNFFLALLCMYGLVYLPALPVSTQFIIALDHMLKNTLGFSLFFGVLDLVPLPPFEGSKLLPVVLPGSAQQYISWLEEKSLFIFLLLFAMPGVSDLFFSGLNRIAIMISVLLARLVI